MRAPNGRPFRGRWIHLGVGIPALRPSPQEPLRDRRAREEYGSYHPKGEFGAVYVACEESTALGELDHRAARLGISRAELLPRLMLTLHLRVQKLLDLTDEHTRAAWGASLEAITREDDYSTCQEIARLARRDGYEAVRYPPYGGSGENYAIFLDRLKPGSELVIEGEAWIGDS